MTAYSSTIYAQNQPAGSGHGINQISQHLHATAAVNALATNDVVSFGYLAPNAIVSGATLKAQSQLDSNGAPTLSFDVGIAGTPQLFMAASALIGRAAGASFDTAMPGAGKLWKNTTGSKQAIIATAHAGAATGVAGVLELEVTYFVEDAVGSPA